MSEKQMNLFDAYLKEYIAVMNYLLQDPERYEEKEFKINDETIYIKKEILFDLLERNSYEKPSEKLAVWARLKWVICDKGHYTKKVYNASEKKQIRMIVIDINIFNWITKLLNTSYK